jgi:hypothetical protein
VGFLSQSGAICTAVLDWSLQENVGFSAFVSMGSMLDVDWGDLITYLGDDPETHSIVIYMESIGDPRSFLSAAREVALTKPIVPTGATQLSNPSMPSGSANSRPTANRQSPSIASSSIRRYRGSKICKGNPPCGNKVQSGKSITPHCSGMLRAVIRPPNSHIGRTKASRLPDRPK